MHDATPRRPPRLHRRLLNRDFVLLWSGQLVSQIGGQVFLVTMMYWAKDATGSAALMGLLGTLTALPSLLVGPIGGALADRVSRRAILVVSDLLRGLAMLALAAWMAMRAGSPDAVLPVLLAVTVWNASLGAVFAPAIGAAIPDLVPRQRVPAANSLRQLSAGVATSVGQGLAGALYALGAPLLIAANGVSFLVSALSESFLRIPRTERRAGDGGALATYVADLRQGLDYAWRRPGVMALLSTSAGLNFFFMPIFILLPFYADEVSGAPSGGYGYLMAAFSAGTLAGSLAAGWVELAPRARGRLMIGCLLGSSLAFGALALLRSFPAAFVCLLLVGALTGIFNLLEISLFQLSTPAAMRGRVLALVFAVSRMASPLGMALGGFLGDLTGKAIGEIYLLCAGATLILTLLAAGRRSFRELVSSQPG